MIKEFLAGDALPAEQAKRVGERALELEGDRTGRLACHFVRTRARGGGER